MATRTITIRGVSDDTLARLRAQAETSRRSLNSEVLRILDDAAGATPAAGRAGTVREVAPAYESLPALPGLPAVPAMHVEPEPVAALQTDVGESVDAAALATVCRRHDIRWLAVFGSGARGEAEPDSDVDVLVEFEPGRTPGFGIVRVAAALRPLFGGRRIDLHTRGGLGRLRAAVMDQARTLYGDA
jgi:uncharacterized protein